ncbi:MAG: hypothetical protein MK105_16640 [Crocinitomicaceae bacterium]|nr:hypothetical protein [Crocinitomicaceae bacterium]
MKKLRNITIAALTSLTLLSCGGSAGVVSHNAKGFGELETELKSEFGDNAYYTNLTVMNIESMGTSLNVTVTDDPASLTMGEWHNGLGSWEQTSEISLEVPEGTQAVDFMYQLNDQFSLTKLGGLVEESIKSLKTEKKIDNPVMSMAYIKFPDNGDVAKAEYVVQLNPENGGTSFTYSYSLEGELNDMNY